MKETFRASRGCRPLLILFSQLIQALHVEDSRPMSLCRSIQGARPSLPASFELNAKQVFWARGVPSLASSAASRRLCGRSGCEYNPQFSLPLVAPRGRVAMCTTCPPVFRWPRLEVQLSGLRRVGCRGARGATAIRCEALAVAASWAGS